MPVGVYIHCCHGDLCAWLNSILFLFKTATTRFALSCASCFALTLLASGSRNSSVEIQHPDFPRTAILCFLGLWAPLLAFSLLSRREEQVGGKPETAYSVPGKGGHCIPSSSLGRVDFPAWITVFKCLRTLDFQRSSKGKRNKIKLTSFGFPSLSWWLFCFCDAL